MKSKNYVNSLVEILTNLDFDGIDQITETIRGLNGGTLYIAGNGGNAANALHIATDLSKGLYVSQGKGLNVKVLGENPALLSAAVNDMPANEYYAFLLKMQSKPGDLLLVYTAGGTSTNIVKAAEYAKLNGMKVIALTGGKGLLNKSKFDLQLHVYSDNIQFVEDVHAVIGHILFSGLNNCDS
jgi:D-sedoheptulose 7-phosphate isomerase